MQSHPVLREVCHLFFLVRFLFNVQKVWNQIRLLDLVNVLDEISKRNSGTKHRDERFEKWLEILDNTKTYHMCSHVGRNLYETKTILLEETSRRDFRTKLLNEAWRREFWTELRDENSRRNSCGEKLIWKFFITSHVLNFASIWRFYYFKNELKNNIFWYHYIHTWRKQALKPID